MLKDEYEALDYPAGFGDSISFEEIGVGEGLTKEWSDVRPDI